MWLIVLGGEVWLVEASGLCSTFARSAFVEAHSFGTCAFEDASTAAV